MTNAEVVLEADGTRLLTWQSTAPVTIRVSNAPEEPGTVVAEGVDGTEWRYEKRIDSRKFFTIEPEGGEAVVTALRVLPLEGGRNFRDLGGYETRDGKTVRGGQVYRSGVMHELTDADYDYLSSLGIDVVCDFRSREERAGEPTDWRAGAIDYMTWDYSAESSSDDLFAVFRNPDATPADVTNLMSQMYADSLISEHAKRFEAMFDRLIEGDTPLAFNCSAGKDRTGMAAALLLTALDVPQDVVVADYAMSEKVVDYMQAFASDDEKIEEDSPYAFLAQLPREMLAPLLRSDPRYIEHAFAKIESEHGSVLNFIQTELSVDDDELATLRANLLE
ncbi:MAG: tyrosine-protein phosphatase [Proteobacteria bacterium]|nr:tyrosine-protein phosphatase [Pseudomonadota bacterium]